VASNRAIHAIALTGGPGGGKSAFLRHLREHPVLGGRVVVMEEAIHLMRFVRLAPITPAFQRRSPRATRSHLDADGGHAGAMRRRSDGGRVPVGRRCGIGASGSTMMAVSALMPAAVLMVRCGPPYVAGRRNVGWAKADQQVAARTAE
jgi:hypothetical protein